MDDLKEMVDVVGVDHVSVGTDQQPNPGLVQEYTAFTRLVDAMLTGGFPPGDTAKIVGGNYLRIFAVSCG